MAIKYLSGDIFASKCDVIVNPVNTVGVMGKGLALQFKTRYPQMFTQYKQICDGRFTVGKLWFYDNGNKTVLCFPTKQDWRHPSRIEYIESGLKVFRKSAIKRGIKSVAFPRLGSGLGGLDFDKQVKPLMVKYLSDLDIDIEIYI